MIIDTDLAGNTPNACDDTCVPIHNFPDEASRQEYDEYLADSRRNTDTSTGCSRGLMEEVFTSSVK